MSLWKTQSNQSFDHGGPHGNSADDDVISFAARVLSDSTMEGAEAFKKSL